MFTDINEILFPIRKNIQYKSNKILTIENTFWPVITDCILKHIRNKVIILSSQINVYETLSSFESDFRFLDEC